MFFEAARVVCVLLTSNSSEAKQFMKDMLKVNQCQMDTDNVEYLDAFFKTFDIDDNGG